MKDFGDSTPAPLLTPLITLVHKYTLRSPDAAASDDLREVRDTFHRESGRFKRALMRLRIKKAGQHQVREAQQDLMELIDRVVTEGGAAEIEASRIYPRSVINLLFERLEGLLAYLEHHYSGQFDHDLPLCDGQREIWKIRIHKQMAVVNLWFGEQGLSASLWHIVSEPFFEILAPAGLPLVSHREWKYLSALLTGLEQLTKEEVADAEEALLRLLVHYNFNKDQYLEYCTQYIEAQVSDDEPTNEERLARVLRYRSLIDAVYPTSAHVGLRPGRDALHTRLISWIDKTQTSFQAMMEMSGGVRLLKPRAPRKDAPHKQRLGLKGSGKESTGYARLLYECDFFEEENRSEICRHIAYGLSTPGTREPKLKNVRDDFDELTEVTFRYAESMCEKILRLVSELRSGKRTLKKK